MSTSNKVKVSERKYEAFSKFYLFAYNSAQVVGWSYILYKLIDYYVLKSSDFRQHNSIWVYVHIAVILFQNAAFLEIVHAILGVVKSNPVVTTFQVLSRIMVVVGVVIATPSAKSSPGLPIALFAWSITEVIRYSYYALNVINVLPYMIIYLRYSTFIVLYPIGVTGELLCFWWAQNYAKNVSIWSITMPNKYNITFSYFAILWFTMLLYIPLFPQLYLHMFTQRKKNLQGQVTKDVAKKAN